MDCLLPVPACAPMNEKVVPVVEAVLPSHIVGVDVGKTEIEWAIGPRELPRNDRGSANVQPTVSVKNRERNLKSFLKGLPTGSTLIVESTGRYHRLVCDLAVAQGLTVFVVDPFRVNAYRKHDNQRAKTDACDARLLVRFGRDKYQELRPYWPLSDETSTLMTLVRLRSGYVTHRAAIRQATQEMIPQEQGKRQQGKKEPEPTPVGRNVNHFLAAVRTKADELDAAYTVAIEACEEQILAVIKSAPALQDAYDRISAVPGLGLVATSSLMCALMRGEFRTVEAFIAYIGLDPVAKDSGQSHGKRRLSKKGDPQLRKSVYMGANSLVRNELWKDWIAKQKAKGLTHTAVICILARRLATIAWCLFKRGAVFDPKRVFAAPKQLAVLKPCI